MKLKKIQERIVEILKILSDEERRKKIMCGIKEIALGQLREANRPLFAELKVLEGQQQILINSRQVWIGAVSILVGICAILASIFIAIWVPSHQKIEEQHSEIQAVYKNLITNQDIFISNSNGSRKLENSNSIADLPEFYIEDDINDDARKILQDTFGLIQYRFFLYYLHQTALMNSEIEQIRDYFIVTGAKPFGELNPTKSYLSTMEYLTLEELDTKFNYQYDTECLQYFFEYNFLYLSIDGRGKTECPDSSLNRIFNLGFLEDDTPEWLLPLLKRALNQRESGLGDRYFK
ncbi:MAG: hypothetical protein V1905_03250 [bacterium]